jgi:trehalose/maltose hydrolase-like predicted phosphorylase
MRERWMEPIGGALSLAPTNDPGWLIIEEGVALEREHEIESIFAISNGYVGTRAALEEGGRVSQAATVEAGVYIADRESALGPTLAILPDWTNVNIAIDGHLLTTGSGCILEHRRILDLRQGILWRHWRQRDPSGRTTEIRFLRFASLSDRHALLQVVAVTAENYAGRVEIVACLSAPSAQNKHTQLAMGADGASVTMSAGETQVALATRSIPEPTIEETKSHGEGPTGRIEQRWSWAARLGETIYLQRAAALYVSRDCLDPLRSAQLGVAELNDRGVSSVAMDHAEAWSRRWRIGDIEIRGDAEAQRVLRFAIYHLFAAANPTDEHVSIGARGLTGKAYRGHVFWETEIYMLPFYVLNEPEAARALLMYRHHTLGAAKRKALSLGYSGALYAWESAATGEEATPREVVAPDGRIIRVLTGEQEHHISADIAYAVWLYWRATGDDDFMMEAGCEILVETARFWASRSRVEGDGRAHIRGVIGPDEYHETVDDNAYTNVMARWNLDRAADAVDILKRERPGDWRIKSKRLEIKDDEPPGWRRAAAALVTGFHPETGLFEQFAGYFGLEEVDVANHGGAAMPLDLWLGPERTRRSKAIKQADVIALCALLWDEWPRAVHRDNFVYYAPRTAHGSSLSPAMHALVAARLGDGREALRYFRQAGDIDLADNMGNAAGGVHMGALGGLWQAAIFGAAGVHFREDGFALDPHLLPGWTEMRCCVQWRGRLVRLTLGADPARICVETEGPGRLMIGVIDGPSCSVNPGRLYSICREGATWGSWRAERNL